MNVHERQQLKYSITLFEIYEKRERAKVEKYAKNMELIQKKNNLNL